MDRLVDEAEGLAVDSSSSSVCSGAGGGGRLEATTDQQLSLLNSITASDLTGESLHRPLSEWGGKSFEELLTLSLSLSLTLCLSLPFELSSKFVLVPLHMQLRKSNY